MKRALTATICALVLVSSALALPSSGAAQAVDVTLRGVVLDESRAALPGATIAATNTATALLRQTVTDGEGRYVLPGLPAGTYDVQAELSGFATQIRRGQVFHVGTTITLDFTLALGAVTETVEVRADAPILETTKSTLSRIVQQKELDALPVLSRSFSELAALAPGVVTRSGAIEIGGSLSFQNAIQVDGVSAEYNLSGGQRIQYSQDWIQEFQVMTNQFGAEYGGVSGGVLNAITRSGSNRLRGRLYSFFRDDAWDAMPAFAPRKPPLEQQRLGFTSGGPIRKNRLFYFAGLEWFNNKSSSIVASAFPSYNGTFPTKTTRTLALFKAEYDLNNSNRLRFRVNSQRLKESGSGIGGTTAEEHGTFGQTPAEDYMGDWTTTISPTMLNEARVAYVIQRSETTCNYQSRNAPGTWFERLYPGATFGCFNFLGDSSESQVLFSDAFSITRGGHQIKVGFQAARTRFNSHIRNDREGRYWFDRDILFSPDNPASYPYAFFVVQGPIDFDVPSWSGGGYVQDSWTVTSEFTLNAGLRYDVDGAYSAMNQFITAGRGLHRFNPDKNNISPRVGFAWTPFNDERRTLLRGGAGLYYDQEHYNIIGAIMTKTINVDRVLNINALTPLLNPYWPDTAIVRRFLAEALARNTIPDPAVLPAVVSAVNDVLEDTQIPKTVQASAGVAHDFQRGLTMSVDVVYARGLDQYIIRDVNVDPVTFRRINPNYSTINAWGNGGRFSNRSLRLQASFAPNERQSLKLAYTLAKSTSNTASTLGSRSAGATNPFDFSEDEGPADNDIRQALNLSGSIALPYDIQMAGILSYRSGLPYTVSTPVQLDADPWPDRPEPRNSRRGDTSVSLDARLSKSVRLGGRTSATAFLEAFNLTNATNYTGYVGTITSRLFGQPTSAEPKRRLQLGFRVEF